MTDGSAAVAGDTYSIPPATSRATRLIMEAGSLRLRVRLWSGGNPGRKAPPEQTRFRPPLRTARRARGAGARLAVSVERQVIRLHVTAGSPPRRDPLLETRRPEW